VADLDWEDLGRAWGLLKLPKMPELKHWQGDKELGLETDFASYAYRDKQREQIRRRELQAHAQGLPDNSIKAPPPLSASLTKDSKRAWSDKLDQRIEREKRRAKKTLARERRIWAAMTPAEREKKRELEKMIEQVKEARMAEEAEGEFTGFGD
jgi:ATP-dependent RNA helicase DDX55/SPB4